MEALSPTKNAPDAAFWRSNFFYMSLVFAACQAMVTTPIGFATSMLDSTVGAIGTGILDLAAAVAALVLGAPLVDALGPRRGLIVAELFSTSYAVLFATSMMFPAGSTAQWVTYVLGAVAAGVGAGMLWTAQGVFLTASIARVSELSGENRSDVSAQLAGVFGSTLLLGEFLAKSCASLLQGKFLQYHLFEPLLGLQSMFWLFAMIAATMTCLQTRCVEPPVGQQKASGMCDKMGKAFATWSMPGIWLLGIMNFLFGFGAAYMNGYVNGVLVKQHAYFGVGSLGSLTALTCLVGVAASRLFAKCSVAYGKGTVMAVGSLAFFLIPTIVLLGTSGELAMLPARLGIGLITCFVLQGVGRGVYESTNKGVLVDYFPEHLSAGVFATQRMQNSLGFFGSFLLQGVLHEREVLGYIILVCAALVMPCYMLAWKLHRPANDLNESLVGSSGGA